MLNILILLLKIIMYIILGLLGLVLFIVLIVLFAPINYKVLADCHDTAIVKAKLRYLFVSISVCFDQKDKKLENTIRVAGIRIGRGKGHKTKRTSEKTVEENENNNSSDEGKKEIIDKTEAEENNIQKTVEKKQEENQQEIQEEIQQGIQQDKNLTENTILEEQTKKESKKKNKISKKNKKREESNSSGDKLEEVKKKLNALKQFWQLDCTVKTRSYLKRYLFKTIKHIGPRKIKGNVRYGFDDPSQTGEVTGYLSMMPFVYQKDFSLEPDFYNKIIEGNVEMRGRIVLGYILRIAVNINIWKTLFAAKKVLS